MSVNFCPSCGAQRLTGSSVCASCGAGLEAPDTWTGAAAPAATPQPEPAARPRRGRMLVLLAVAIVAVVAIAGTGIVVMRPGGHATYRTPDDAVRAYLAGVAEGNADKILGACDVDRVAEGFKLDVQAQRLNALMLFSSLAPSEYPFYASLDRAEQSAAVLRQVRNLAYSLLSQERLDQTIAPVDLARVRQFVRDVDPRGLSGLEVVSIKFPNPSMDGQGYRASMNKLAATYGADEATERVALVKLDGKHYVVGFTLFRYVTDWAVWQQVSNLAGTNPGGAVSPTDPSEFERLTSGG